MYAFKRMSFMQPVRGLLIVPDYGLVQLRAVISNLLLVHLQSNWLYVQGLLLRHYGIGEEGSV